MASGFFSRIFDGTVLAEQGAVDEGRAKTEGQKMHAKRVKYVYMDI